MSFIDSAIAVISPKRACERAAWRAELDALRAYDAGNDGRLNAGWRVANQSAEQTDKVSRDVIRTRARDLERNSDIAGSVLSAFRRNVMGRGYTLQCKTGDTALDNEIEAAWRRWCRPRSCDVTGAQSFYQMMSMAVTRKKVDGGILFLKRYTRGGVVPLHLQAIEVDELETAQSVPHLRGDKVVGGVEYDAYHRPVGYFIRQYDLDGWQILDPVFLPEKDVIFYFSKRRPSQLREMSDLTPILTRVRDANEFITAVSVKERIAACLSVLIKRAVPLGGWGRSGAPAPGQRVEYSGKKLTPGMMQELNAGDEVEVVNPGNTGSESTGFLKTLWALVGAGSGLSYESVSRDMSQTNYSSARQGAIEDEGTFAEEIELLEGVMSEIYESFVISGYLSGLFTLPGFWEKKDTYLAHQWVKTPKKWIDPAKESNANRIALMSGQKTFKDMAAEGGKDWKESIDDMIEVLEYGRAGGIELGGILFGQKQAAGDAQHGGNSGGSGAGGQPQKNSQLFQ